MIAALFWQAAKGGVAVILAIDPQYRFAGWAVVFSDGDVQAGTADYDAGRKKDDALDPVRACRDAAVWIRELYDNYSGVEAECRIVIELPDWHRPGTGNQGVAGLFKIAAVAGAMALEVVGYVGGDVRLVQPRQWKGRKRKADTLLEVAAHLKATPTQIRRLYDQHAVDAIGLGLWRLRRGYGDVP